MAMNWMKVRHQTEVEQAFRLCRYSLALVAGLPLLVAAGVLAVEVFGDSPGGARRVFAESGPGTGMYG